MADIITGISAATAGKLDAAIQKINLAWLNPRQMFEQTLTGEVAYFDYQAGDQIDFWMRLSPFREKEKSLTATRDFSESGKVLMAQVGYSRWDLYSELVPISSTSDPYGIFLQFTEGAVDYFTRFPLRRVVKLLQQNGNCLFDGLSFFNSAHIIDPTSKDTSKTFPNDLQFKVTETGWAALKDQIMQVKAPNGYLSNVTMGKPVIWVPSDAMHIKFAKLFGVGNGGGMGTFQAKEVTAGVTAASESITVTSTATIVTVPELLAGKDIDNPAVTLDSDADKHYYVWLNNMNADRGVVVRMPRPMTVRRSSGGPDDANVQNNNALAAWSDCEAGFGYGAPHKCFRVKDA